MYLHYLPNMSWYPFHSWASTYTLSAQHLCVCSLQVLTLQEGPDRTVNVQADETLCVQADLIIDCIWMA